MSSEKRLILFMIATFGSIVVIDYVTKVTGLSQAPEKPLPKAAAKAEPAKNETKPAPAAPAKTAAPTPPEKARPNARPTGEVPMLDPRELILGANRDTSPDGYHLQVELDQKGASVVAVSSSRYEAEFEEGKPRHRPLQIIDYDPPPTPQSLSLSLLPANALSPEQAKAVQATTEGELTLEKQVWQVVRDAGQPAVRTIKDPNTGALVGQEVSFRTEVEGLGLTVTKTFRLRKQSDAFEMDVTFSSKEKTQQVAYRLLGPHGLPIEGAWYTGTFREAVFGQIKDASTKVDTLSAYDIVKNESNPDWSRFQKYPLGYAGVENQYFVSFVAPEPPPTSDENRWDAESKPLVLHPDPKDPESKYKYAIGVEILSRPFTVGPNASQTHTYKIYAGPKLVDNLAPLGAQGLATYRKSSFIPFASEIARLVISPLLKVTYNITVTVSRAFGGKAGNYGIAIILLTLIVRMVMFPLGRKQAIAAKKMQDLQPLLKEIQVKYKDDKETQTKETFALYKRHGVNPMGGCLPALIQLPIFVGLWQALNTSVYLRHASFLWIKDLAAPDMLFKIPFELPLIGGYIGQYFNLLPFLVVALMLVQTKLFSPPATTPEAEMQQKTMKYMMVFMAFMFYKVPSGLGLYFITSSLWQVSERLLLPKVSTTAPTPAAESGGSAGAGGGGGGGGGGRGGSAGGSTPPKPPGRIAAFFEKLMEEASKDSTYRKLVEEKAKEKEPERDRDGGNRDRGKPRARPGRRR